MIKIPRLSAPLSKAIRTSEGVAAWAINLACLVGALIPNDGLSTKTALFVAGANSSLHGAQRLLLKVTAVTKGLGVGDAIVPTALADAEPTVEKAAQTIVPQVVEDIEKPSADRIFDQALADEDELVAKPGSEASTPAPTDAAAPAAPAEPTPPQPLESAVTPDPVPPAAASEPVPTPPAPPAAA